MNTTIDSIDLEHDLIQWTTTEAVRLGLGTSLRDPILEAVSDETGDGTSEKPTDGETEKSLTTTILQGLTVFTVLVAVLYASLRRLAGNEES